jgi:hypothetical protein
VLTTPLPGRPMCRERANQAALLASVGIANAEGPVKLTDVGPRPVRLVACTGGGWPGREFLAVRRRPRLPWCWRGADAFRRGARHARLVEYAKPRIAHRDLELRLLVRPYHRVAAANGPDDLLRLALDVRLHRPSRNRRRFRVVHRLSRGGRGGAFPGEAHHLTPRARRSRHWRSTRHWLSGGSCSASASPGA